MDVVAAAERHSLDPFAYHPGVASGIPGLFDGARSDNPNYVFHTSYVPLGRGIVYATLKFTGLTARKGSLVVSVHLFRETSGPQLILVTSERTAFNRLIHHGSELTIRFEAFAECQYALYGSILGDTDAQADGLTITVSPATEVDELGYHTEARNTSYGADASRPEAILVSVVPPVLAAPVSQIATGEQLAVAADVGHGVLSSWSDTFVGHALHAYGALGRGARGLILGPWAGAERHRAVTNGVELIDGAVASIDDRRTLVNFDFLVSVEVDGIEDAIEEWEERLHERLHHLLPGGLAVFTFRYWPEPAQDGVGPLGVVNRVALERAALMLISRGHEVAQLRVVGPYEPLRDEVDGCSAAGLIVRRARLPD